ncbi:GGDEF domain-containing protein [Agrobacterium sp. T29]|uniref:GGDEF domain-containing protein n=1 Tax=Agrobacterium sp. T29 TaxID=2580515 RepID=UPI00115F34DC|nr:GGDEF domain-containing protein [Agrobacterium sp. T29]
MMEVRLDLSTVLFLQQTSYLAAAVTLIYVNRTLPGTRGTAEIALSFVILMFGATAASMIETTTSFYSSLALVSVVLGVFGYSLMTLGCFRLSWQRCNIPTWLVAIPAGIVLVVGLLTNFHAGNQMRATLFNSLAAIALGLCAWRFYRDRVAESLPVRTFLSLQFLACAGLCLVLSVEFYLNRFDLIQPTTGFFWLIIFKFLLSLFSIILATERVKIKLDGFANTDAMTGAHNRRFFFEKARPGFAAGDAIILLDLDHFKQLNDTWGHDFGDHVLKSVVVSIKGVLREADVFARYGGEEFIAFIPRVSPRQSEEIAERIRAAIAAVKFQTSEAEIAVTVSVGIAIAIGQAELEETISRADMALYSAKKAGRNRVEVWERASNPTCMETSGKRIAVG